LRGVLKATTESVRIIGQMIFKGSPEKNQKQTKLKIKKLKAASNFDQDEIIDEI